jgi:hypothetical protein
MNDLDTARAKALAQLDRAALYFKLALFGAMSFEGLFLVAIFLTADLKDPLHRLILFCTGLIYMPIILGLTALGAYVNRCTLRVLARLDDRA